MIQASSGNVADHYSELAHYTGSAGLKGIIDSQCLWASNAFFLNDVREIEYFFSVRCRTLVAVTLKKQAAISAVAPKLLEDPDKTVQVFASSLRRTTFVHNSTHVLSFCGSIDNVVSRDGLLGQWRAYGQDGGYAVFFDSKELESRLRGEWARFHYNNLLIADVHYYREDMDVSKFRPEIQSWESAFCEGVKKFLSRPEPEALFDLYAPTTALCCLYKHWGFHEEREVRVVAIPLQQEIPREDPTRKEKGVGAFLRNGMLVPYIELLRATDEENGGSLPVSRIVVGPHRDAARRKEALVCVLRGRGLDWPVQISEIPYAG